MTLAMTGTDIADHLCLVAETVSRILHPLAPARTVTLSQSSIAFGEVLA
jgi:hypothetical protein